MAFVIIPYPYYGCNGKITSALNLRAQVLG